MKKIMIMIGLIAASMASANSNAQVIDCIYNSPKEFRVMLQKGIENSWNIDIIASGNVRYSGPAAVSGPTIADTTIYFQSTQNVDAYYTHGLLPLWALTMYSQRMVDLTIYSPTILRKLSMDPLNHHSVNLRCTVK